MMRTAYLVALKDLRIELRSRVLLWQVLPFGLMALVLCGLAVGPDARQQSRIAPGLFYLVVTLVALLVINRSSQIESPRGTRTSLLTLGLDAGGVFLGKAAAMLVQLFATATALLFGTTVLLHVPVHAALVTLPSVLLATATLSAAGVLYGLVASSSSSSATLLPVLALPAFAPILIAGERSFSSLISAGSLSRWVLLLIFSLVAYGSIGVLLYGALEES